MGLVGRSRARARVRVRCLHVVLSSAVNSCSHSVPLPGHVRVRSMTCHDTRTPVSLRNYGVHVVLPGLRRPKLMCH